MFARVAFGLRGMWLPLFFQILGNMVFVRISESLFGSCVVLTWEYSLDYKLSTVAKPSAS